MADTIYFAGTEDVDFLPIVGTIIVVTNTALIRSAFVRAGFETLAVIAADPPTNRVPSPTFTPVSTLWVHGQFCEVTDNSTIANDQALQVLDGGVARILVRGTGTNGQLKISTRNAAGTITDLVTSSSNAWPNNVVTGFDLFINYAVAGTVTLYIGGVQVATFSGDVTTNGATTLNQIMLSNPCVNGWVWSEIIVANADTRAKGLWQLNTSTAGNADQWTGALANVNKNTINDATWISASSNGLIQEYTVTSSVPTGSYNVDAVVMSARAQVGSTGPQHLDFVTRLGGADFASADLAPAIGTFGNLNNIQATNPNTTLAWALSDLTAAGVNYGVKSAA